MRSPPANAKELSHHKKLLSLPVGQPGSGAARYGAAMYFYRNQMMTLELLEIYRRCCKFDHEDPKDLAAFEGVRNQLLHEE